MIFAPKPENCFDEFIETYYRECTGRFPKIEAIAGKWEFPDLIPGLSDFDTRFLCADDMTPEDWCEMSQAVGEVHLKLCIERPEWARILEHLPGVNPTWSEFIDDESYYPEYGQWSIYHAGNTGKWREAEQALGRHPWDARDEYFFLKKFFTYYGPYNRGIDPAINMGRFENKYPLHSRIMHYFSPPLQAAVSILEKKPCKGKFSAFEKAEKFFPTLSVLREIQEIAARHYEVPALYEESALTRLEERLRAALDVLLEAIQPEITILPVEEGDDGASLRKKIAAVPVSPLLKLFDSSRFCRLFKGRLFFYANAPAHFDNIWLIQNELSRIGEMFFKGPYRIYWETVTGERTENPVTILDALTPAVISKEEADAAREFARLTPGSWEPGSEVETARAIIPIFDHVFTGLYKLNESLKRFLAQHGKPTAGEENR